MKLQNSYNKWTNEWGLDKNSILKPYCHEKT